MKKKNRFMRLAKPAELVPPSVINLVIIRSEDMINYKPELEKQFSNLNIIFLEHYSDAARMIKGNSERIFHLVIPELLKECLSSASKLAFEIKKINSENKIYCYSGSDLSEINDIDNFVTGYEKEDELFVIYSLIKKMK